MELRLFPDFPFGSDGKASVYNVRDLGSIPGLGRFPREGNGYTLQYSCLENPVGQRSLAGYSPWGHKENNNNSILKGNHGSHFSVFVLPFLIHYMNINVYFL